MGPLPAGAAAWKAPTGAKPRGAPGLPVRSMRTLGPLGGAPLTEQALGRARGAGRGRGWGRAAQPTRHAAPTASFCCVCVWLGVWTRACLHPSAGRRRSAHRPGLFLPRWLARWGPCGGPASLTPRLPGRARWRSLWAAYLHEMGNFVSGFWVASKCLPEGGRDGSRTPQAIAPCLSLLTLL